MRRAILVVSFALLGSLVQVESSQAQTPAAPSFVPVPDNAILSSNVTGLGIYNSANQKVGEIKDVVIESGRLAGYVLSVGGFLGIGTRHVVVAPAGLIISYDPKAKGWRAKIDATKEQLKAAPAFLYEDRWAR
ncbi:PRC-barrel domain-containing protein [Lichenifustis flavocetrariae]|uniref:PRC-barrel domain-containing protein n=1 Tax=Lichenifustis flavocetrariae TaxID=2949735 RepID=A0AA42CI84_9HYPH|nr:PRC-barrel domain-containing protein [Lichenifustis flavocetrariae]MCW6508089.1 PRC-barrel domain-containing protein [Lichenifustis flavocetrariae]